MSESVSCAVFALILQRRVYQEERVDCGLLKNIAIPLWPGTGTSIITKWVDALAMLDIPELLLTTVSKLLLTKKLPLRLLA